MLQTPPYANLRTAILVTLFMIAITAGFYFQSGKIDSFLFINSCYTPAADVFFKYMTHFGDGLIYVPLVLYCIFYNRKFLIPALLSIIICLLLTHVLKQLVFPDLLRPISLETQGYVVHKVEGVRVHRQNSFPSGHTATAFATALLLATVLRRRIWPYLLPIVPFLVAYSRVYLAQHFVSDVLGGMIIGLLTAVLSVLLHPRVMRNLPQHWHPHLGY